MPLSPTLPLTSAPRLARDVHFEAFHADATTAVPLERWDPEVPPASALFGLAPLRFGVFLPPSAAAGFDASAFGVSAPEAALMDPQQRLLLEAAAEALLPSDDRGAATKAAAAAGASACSVYVGISSMDYQKLGSRYGGEVSAYSATGVSLSVAAGRVSYTFGLTGPSAAIDTACSSSLVAARSAVLSLGCEHAGGAALVGGANLALFPDTPAMFKRAGGSPVSRGVWVAVKGPRFYVLDACNDSNATILQAASKPLTVRLHPA
jgi:acyl transferase domain-containing protein